MIQRPFMCLCDRLEYVLSRWWGVALYVAGCVVFWLISWDAVDRWIYTSGVLLVVLLIGNARRSDKAMHIKLDDIDPRVEHNHLELHDECEMDA